MAGKPGLLYWDTCVFLAWVKREQDWPEDVTKGIAQTVENWVAGKLVIVTSSLTMLEILSTQLSLEQKNTFRRAFSHPRLQMVDLDRRISSKASVIRQHYDDRVFKSDGSVLSGRNIGIGDAIHLATALSVDRLIEFQTLDGVGKRKRKYDLLALGDEVVGARLKIRLPKYIPEPVFTEPPGLTLEGAQQALFQQTANATLVHKDDCIREIIRVINHAIQNGRFKEAHEAATKALNNPVGG